MGEKSSISWTENTWNCWQGCTKVSPGCAHCYMFRDKIKYGQNPEVVVRSSPATFNKPLLWQKQVAKNNKRLLVFTCSWSDFFHADADAWRDEAWAIIKQTPNLVYQILTKRPERILGHLPADWGDGYPNVWLGTSVENQHFADIRIPLLLKVPAIVHFLSCEPLLGQLDLREYLARSWQARAILHSSIKSHYVETDEVHDNAECLECDAAWGWGDSETINWVIVGGESGPNFRPMQPEWARSLRDQCAAGNVAFWYKQDCGLRPGMNPALDGVEYHQFPQAAILIGDAEA